MATTRTLDGALLDLALSVRQRPVRALDDTDSRILVESIQLFAAHGYAGTSMRQIAAAVGIQAATIYSHFPSKQVIHADAHCPRNPHGCLCIFCDNDFCCVFKA